MRYLWILLIVGITIQVEAMGPFSKLPPSEMIMMGGFDDDDVESIEERPVNPNLGKKVTGKQIQTTDIYIKNNPKKSIDLSQKPNIDNAVEESIEFSEYSQDQDFSQNSSFSDYMTKGSLKIALLVPKNVIKAYAHSVSNAIMSYLIFKDIPFQYEVFDSGDEEELSIVSKLNEIRAKGYQFVIAPFTLKGAEVLMRNAPDILVFIPTINKYEVPNATTNVIFGGIDYKRQIDALLTYANDKIALFNDGSRRSYELTNYIKESTYDNIVYEKEVKNIKTDLSGAIKYNKKLKNASIFLNMPIVKSSLLASQLSQYEIKPHILLSTQANYNPLLFKLTQSKDREYFYIANSISNYDPKLKEINLLLGNNPDFSWIDYSASIGMDYIVSTQLESGYRVFDEDIYDNQIEYKVEVKKAGTSSFEQVEDMQESRFLNLPKLKKEKIFINSY
jgi:hypothetical protein